MRSLTRLFKTLTGKPLSAEDFDVLWAALPDEGTEEINASDTYSMPDRRLCATQIVDGKWDIHPERRIMPFPWASPLTLSLVYENTALPVALNIPTAEMLTILRAQDNRNVGLPHHISTVCPS